MKMRPPWSRVCHAQPHKVTSWFTSVARSCPQVAVCMQYSLRKSSIVVSSGSSREHAAWAIAGYGFRVVVSSFFADIHKNNELNNFVLPVVVTEGFLQELFDSIFADPKMEVEVNLPEQTITNKATGKSEHFEINAYKKLCLMNGLDDIDFLLSNKNKIEEWENKASK